MKEIISILLKCIQFIFSLIADLFSAIVDAFSKQKGFNAEFGSERSIASRFNNGFVISKNRRLSRKASFSNLLLVGPTGSGKTSRILLKNLFALKKCSLIVNDPSGELFMRSSGYLSQYFKILTINFSDTSASTGGFNILSRIKKPNDVNKIAHLLVATSLDKGNSDFWSISTKSLLSILIRLTLHQREQYRNMANVLHLLHTLAAYPERIDVLVANSKDEKLLLDYKSCISTPERTLQNIIASTKAALQLFDDPEIAKTTAQDNISFDEIRATPTIIFLHNSVGDQKYVSILNSIFFEQFYNHVLQRLPSKKELDLFVILEEASSMYIPLLALATANCRKARVGNIIAVQTKGQLKTFYKDDAENIAANCLTKLYLPGQTAMDELREIEALGGKSIYTDEKGIERVKSLITTDEIRLLPENRSVIISGNKPLIKGRTSPYYRSLIYSSYGKISSVSLERSIPDTPVPLIELK
ncbi:type IV secretory system conjugative DNA transfer family protein [Mucilaginibacter rubeus]|uniref:Type IV secretion system DNA-binding domain-containing protein n=1 Tax=Mucilaginibacter rubeus TaxID=2027860 RepID=A0A5C1I682_9SPHI|nr:type IV secretory system conjugative DNA transfer family protein [Mucilaginibacter rubeus]QEM12978.1 type IV secretion system DNA-binding domain-containing protein [Mucilaginibacter rubeus]